MNREHLYELEWAKYASWPPAADLGFPQLLSSSEGASEATSVSDELAQVRQARLSELQNFTAKEKSELLQRDPLLRSAHISFLGAAGSYGAALEKGEIL